MRLLIAAAGVLISNSATANEELVLKMMRATMDIEGSAQELAIHIGGMQDCKLDGILNPDDMNVIGNAYRRADEKAFTAGSMKGVLILKGLSLKPGSKECAVVKTKIEEAVPDYVKLAASMRKNGF